MPSGRDTSSPRRHRPGQRHAPSMPSRLAACTLRAPVAVLLALSMLCSASCSRGDTTEQRPAGRNVLNVYNWSDYVAPDTISNFEREYGIRVNYDVYDSSEIVDAKLLAGRSGYDVVFHSYQFASRLTPLGIFRKLDTSRLDNLRYLNDELLEKISLYEAVEGYAVPYLWGSTGFAYNYDMVRARLPDAPLDSAAMIFDPEVVSKLADCGVTLLDSGTDVIPMVLAYLGRDPNAVDPDSLAAAEAQLDLVRPYIRYFSSTKMISDLPNREVCVAMSWSGDYAQASARAAEAGIDIDLRYTMPKEGSGLWVDGMFIPADAPHPDNAYLFMNYILRPEVTADISNFVFYANANEASRPLIRPEVLEDPGIYPDEAAWDLFYPVYFGDPARERLRTRTWARVKSGI
ncbi:MAG TPA: polyamine ABC transporter substrate-binding protein [Woeseiaceae bacterium]|nr:polyamine ABC transporter substrate-binding protein [Woeseiaceae bacterium]